MVSSLFLSLVLITPLSAQAGEPEIIVSGKDTTYNTNLEGDPPLKSYTSSPPLMVAAEVGSGAVVATGSVSTTRDTRWNGEGNPAPNFDVLLDKAFQWMVPGATKVLWFEGYGVYNTIDAPEVQCQQLEDALEAKGYTLTGDTTTPITSGLLSSYDIMVIPQMQLGETGTGGNPALLPDSDVQAIVDFVSGGGGLLIMESSDYLGLNYSEVHNKILKALGVGFYFQDDQVQDDTNQWEQAAFQVIADVNTTEFGSAYQSETGTDEIGLYSLCSLRIEVDYEVSVTVSPTVNVGGAGAVLIYEATITNIGTKSDDFTLTIDDELGWPTSLSKNAVSLEPSESEVVEASVTVPTNLTEKVVNWVTITASGVSEDDARGRAINVFPQDEPPYEIVRPDVTRFLGPGLPTLLVDSPAVPVITAIETGFGTDITPREPEPILYGKGEFAPVVAVELIGNGRVMAFPNSILRDAYYDRPELASDEVTSMIVRWMLDWEDPRGSSLFYWVTEGSYHLPPGTSAPIVTKYVEDTLEEGLGIEVGTQVGGEITSGLIAGYDILHLNEILEPLSSEEIQAVVDFVNGGGGLIIGSQADYGGYGRPTYPNEVLEALGSGIRFQDDELYDEDSWVVDGPWYPQVYLLDAREANAEFDVWFPAHDFSISMPVKSMTLESAPAVFKTTLINDGTADSTYTIEVTETTTPASLGWDIEVKPAEIDVAAGENVEIYTILTVPDIESGRKRMDLNIKVTDAVQDYLTKSDRFAVLGEDGRTPTEEAKLEVGQSVSHADWGGSFCYFDRVSRVRGPIIY
ncbi:hypothetical protein ES703_07213 [subsurface metagenome]